jgi:uncharacterized protein YggE
MRRAFLPIVLVGLLVLAGCLAPLGTASAADANSDNSTVVATGVGSVSTDADLAQLTLAVSSTADTADDARGQTATRVDALVTALTDAGVDEANVTTTSFTLTPLYDYREGGRQLLGYRAVHVLQVEVAPADAGRIVDTSVGAAEVEIWGVAFTLSDERRAELRSEAIADAVANARNDADAAAGAAGLTITGVDSVQVGGYAYPVARYAEAAAEDGSTEFMPGPVTVSASVTVSYRTE